MTRRATTIRGKRTSSLLVDVRQVGLSLSVSETKY